MSGARPSDGSSAISTSGGRTSSGASVSICCSPPDRLPAGRLPGAHRGPGTARRPRRARRRPAATAAGSRATVRPGKIAPRLGRQDEPAAAPAGRRAGAVTSRPSSTNVPRGRGDEPGDRRHSVDLPAPLGPSSAVIVPGGTVEVDAVQHLDLAVAAWTPRRTSTVSRRRPRPRPWRRGRPTAATWRASGRRRPRAPSRRSGRAPRRRSGAWRPDVAARRRPSPAGSAAP